MDNRQCWETWIDQLKVSLPMLLDQVATGSSDFLLIDSDRLLANAYPAEKVRPFWDPSVKETNECNYSPGESDFLFYHMV